MWPKNVNYVNESSVGSSRCRRCRHLVKDCSWTETHRCVTCSVTDVNKEPIVKFQRIDNDISINIERIPFVLNFDSNKVSYHGGEKKLGTKTARKLSAIGKKFSELSQKSAKKRMPAIKTKKIVTRLRARIMNEKNKEGRDAGFGKGRKHNKGRPRKRRIAALNAEAMVGAMYEDVTPPKKVKLAWNNDVDDNVTEEKAVNQKSSKNKLKKISHSSNSKNLSLKEKSGKKIRVAKDKALSKGSEILKHAVKSCKDLIKGKQKQTDKKKLFKKPLRTSKGSNSRTSREVDMDAVIDTRSCKRVASLNAMALLVASTLDAQRGKSLIKVRRSPRIEPEMKIEVKTEELVDLTKTPTPSSSVSTWTPDSKHTLSSLSSASSESVPCSQHQKVLDKNKESQRQSLRRALTSDHQNSSQSTRKTLTTNAVQVKCESSFNPQPTGSVISGYMQASATPLYSAIQPLPACQCQACSYTRINPLLLQTSYPSAFQAVSPHHPYRPTPAGLPYTHDFYQPAGPLIQTYSDACLLPKPVPIRIPQSQTPDLHQQLPTMGGFLPPPSETIVHCASRKQPQKGINVEQVIEIKEDPERVDSAKSVEVVLDSRDFNTVESTADCIDLSKCQENSNSTGPKDKKRKIFTGAKEQGVNERAIKPTKFKNGEIRYKLVKTGKDKIIGRNNYSSQLAKAGKNVKVKSAVRSTVVCKTGDSNGLTGSDNKTKKHQYLQKASKKSQNDQEKTNQKKESLFLHKRLVYNLSKSQCGELISNCSKSGMLENVTSKGVIQFRPNQNMAFPQNTVVPSALSKLSNISTTKHNSIITSMPTVTAGVSLLKSNAKPLLVTKRKCIGTTKLNADAGPPVLSIIKHKTGALVRSRHLSGPPVLSPIKSVYDDSTATSGSEIAASIDSGPPVLIRQTVPPPLHSGNGVRPLAGTSLLPKLEASTSSRYNAIVSRAGKQTYGNLCKSSSQTVAVSKSGTGCNFVPAKTPVKHITDTPVLSKSKHSTSISVTPKLESVRQIKISEKKVVTKQPLKKSPKVVNLKVSHGKFSKSNGGEVKPKPASSHKRKSPEIDEKAVKSSSGVVKVSRKQVERFRLSYEWTLHGQSSEKLVYAQNDVLPKMRKCFDGIKHAEGDVIKVRDCVLLKSGFRKKDLPFIAKVASFYENPEDGEIMMSLLWYYRPEHVELTKLPHCLPTELFASKHQDENNVACIEDKCFVLTHNEYARYLKNKCLHDANWQPSPAIVPEPDEVYPRRDRLPTNDTHSDLVFICRRVYDFRQKRLLKNPS